jgi:hypothetical protein
LAACCYFAAKDREVIQPGLKVFITWDPQKGVETFTVQPRFEGNAADFGMVIPTPSYPKLEPMPRDLFRHLAVYTTLKHREFPRSKLLPPESAVKGAKPDAALPASTKAKPPVTVLESGVVGALDYRVITADRADALYKWLKDNKYHYAGDEAALNFYLQKKWVFTVVKIDPVQMRPRKDGSYWGEVSPMRFQFRTDRPVYPLRIMQPSVRDRTDVQFYVLAPFKADLPGDLTYQRPTPNKQGRTPTTLEWARKLTDQDLKLLTGEAAYSEKLPDMDDGFAPADLKDAKRARAIYKVIEARLEKDRQQRPDGYLVRAAPAEDVRGLRQLVGHLRAGQFLTRFRKTFTRDELSDDLEIVPARRGQTEDTSEYEEILPTPSRPTERGKDSP